jgi:hypothetical protein
MMTAEDTLILCIIILIRAWVWRDDLELGFDEGIGRMKNWG